MHNLDDMIENYRKELLEFSKQNRMHSDEDKFKEYVPTMAEPTENCGNETKEECSEQRQTEKETQYISNVNDEISIKPYANNEDFEMRNGSQGMLRVQVFAADRSFPVSGARVTVDVPFLTGGRELFSGVTDADGIIDNIVLPAPNKNLSLDEDNTAEPFALYDIRVTHPNFAAAEYENVPVFDSVKSIQPVELVPLTQNGNEPNAMIFGGAD